MLTYCSSKLLLLHVLNSGHTEREDFQSLALKKKKITIGKNVCQQYSTKHCFEKNGCTVFSSVKNNYI